MPGSRITRKLFKDPNDLKELAEHLRPRGSYDPLPPPGGYPLPAYIKRKFSFAPQLPIASKISLMPDFASSSLDLGVEIDDSEARNISHDTPTSLWVRYSLESLRQRNASDRQQATSKPSLPRLDTDVASDDKTGRHDSGVAVNNPNDDDQHAPQTAIRRPHSIRRSRGQDSLRHRRAPAASSTQSEYSTDWDTSASDEQSSTTTTTTPRTVLNFTDEKFYPPGSPHTNNGPFSAGHFANADEVTSRVVKQLAERTPNLMGSFCIIDLQLPGYPIRVTSHDMLPKDLADDEVLFLDPSDVGTPYQVKTVCNGARKLQILPIVADLVDVREASARPSHLVVGQVDLTEFLSSQPELDEDVWLAIAYEEMDKAGIRRTYPRSGSLAKDLILAGTKAERAIEMIGSLHRDYFIIGISDAEKRTFGITMVSPTLFASKEVRGKDFLDFPKLSSRLNTPQRFVTRVKWQTAGLRDRLYCIPMSGPHLVCWLCFLVDSELPDLWI
ncbi:MAG: hypothetical protein Q9178_000016 [Gyalolechia marmorata]